MAADELLGEGFCDIGQVKHALFGRELRVVDHLKKQVAKLSLEVDRVRTLDGVDEFIHFFQRMRHDTAPGLLLIPRTAVLRIPQTLHDLDQSRHAALCPRPCRRRGRKAICVGLRRIPMRGGLCLRALRVGFGFFVPGAGSRFVVLHGESCLQIFASPRAVLWHSQSGQSQLGHRQSRPKRADTQSDSGRAARKTAERRTGHHVAFAPQRVAPHSI